MIVSFQCTKFKNRKKGWKINSINRDGFEYSELINGKWESIHIDGERQYKDVPYHIIYLNNDRKWLNYPEWARHRREEITSRIKSEMSLPEFEYENAK